MLTLAAAGIVVVMIIALPPVRGLALRTFGKGTAALTAAAGGGPGAPARPARVRQDKRRRAQCPEMSTRRPAAGHVPGAAPRDYFKRKVALYIAYDGSAYAGLQRNEGVTTVSDVLEAALHKAGAIQESNVGDLSKVGWTVSARTDKGVSAASNVVAFKAAFPRSSDGGDGDAESAKNIDFGKLAAAVNAELPLDVRVLGAAKPTSSFSAKDACSGRRYEYLLPCDALSGRGTLGDFAAILGAFEGTHSFHNFTVGREHRVPPPPPAVRFITRCTCARDPVTIECDGVQKQFARILVQGQSFMLHQIRKMVSLALMVERGVVPADAITRAFDRTLLTNVVPAPAAGLFLDSLHFGAYNKRFADHLTVPIELESCADAREQFKARHIYPSILRRATEEDGMPVFFATAANHPPCFAGSEPAGPAR
jgi:tRNA pseudouridine38-40 synthase